MIDIFELEEIEFIRSAIYFYLAHFDNVRKPDIAKSALSKMDVLEAKGGEVKS